MCSIVGAILSDASGSTPREANVVLKYIWAMSRRRGRDGNGYIVATSGSRIEFRSAASYNPENPIPQIASLAPTVIIGNLRAEPTTEFVQDKSNQDQQPYGFNDDWSIVHNGTISNDKSLRTGRLKTPIDSAAIAEILHGAEPTFDNFVRAVERLRGSYAILAAHATRPEFLFVAANYRPVWYAAGPGGLYFASSRHFFPPSMVPQMAEPYTASIFTANGKLTTTSLRSPLPARSRALVVCSGGLDSTVCATYAQKVLGYEIHLLHFLYGSRAEGPEVKAVQSIANELGAELTLFPLKVYSEGDSPLLDPCSKIAGGEEGAEFAHEWVPARNLLLLSMATAFAEAQGIGIIVLGNNLEEAGAYPDNEPEFIDRFNDLLPFAVGDGKRMQVIMPVGNMMKYEIVAMGHEIGAPLHATWSCYRAGEKHCGTCGPCYMRRKAFEINSIPEVIQYDDEGSNESHC